MLEVGVRLGIFPKTSSNRGGWVKAKVVSRLGGVEGVTTPAPENFDHTPMI